MHDHSQKKLGIRLRLEIVGKINTYTSDIVPCHRKIQPFASWITKNAKDNCRVYEGKDAFLWLPSFGKSSTLKGAVICVLNLKQSEILTGQGSYAVILLVLPLESLTIAKFNSVSVYCFVVALFQLCMYTAFEYLVHILLHMDSLHEHYNFTEI